MELPEGIEKLEIEDENDAVRTLQDELSKVGYNVGRTGSDGDFGKNTEAAVKKFQADNNIPVTGEVDANTAAKLNEKFDEITEAEKAAEALKEKTEELVKKKTAALVDTLDSLTDELIQLNADIKASPTAEKKKRRDEVVASIEKTENAIRAEKDLVSDVSKVADSGVSSGQVPSGELGSADVHRAILNAVRNHLNTVEGMENFPVPLVLAIIKQEAPRENGELVNTGDGLMQVTTASGHRSAAYGNSAEAINRNIRDGVTVLSEFYQGGDQADAICAAWKYNGGGDPCETYARGQGDQEYLGHLADRLENEVADNFGAAYEDAGLVAALRAKQAAVTANCEAALAACP